MLSVTDTFGKLIAQGLLTDSELLPIQEADADPGGFAWALGYAVSEWLLLRGHAAVAIIDDTTALLPTSTAQALSHAITINRDEFDGALLDREVVALCRALCQPS